MRELFHTWIVWKLLNCDAVSNKNDEFWLNFMKFIWIRHDLFEFCMNLFEFCINLYEFDQFLLKLMKISLKFENFVRKKFLKQTIRVRGWARWGISDVITRNQTYENLIEKHAKESYAEFLSGQPKSKKKRSKWDEGRDIANSTSGCTVTDTLLAHKGVTFLEFL